MAWSLGGPRAGGYAAQNPSKVNRLVILAPAYNPKSASEAPKLPAAGTTFNTQSRADFDANWERQVGCPDQYDRAVSDADELVTGYLYTSPRSALHFRLIPMGNGYRYSGHGFWFDGIRGEATLDIGRQQTNCTVVYGT